MLDRTTLIRGPALITWNSFEYYSKDDIVLNMDQKTFELITSCHGKVDERIDDRQIEVSFTPCGEWESASKTGLFVGASTVAGASWYGATDLPMVIKTLSGRQLTLHNVNITKIPSLILSANKTLIGPVTFRALNVNSVDWDAAASLMTDAATTFTNFALFSTAAIVTQGYSGVWTGKTGFAALQTVDGFQVDFDLKISPVEVDSYGCIDYTFEYLDVTCRCQPIGPTVAEAIAAQGLQGASAARGRSLNSISADLIMSSLALTNPVVAAAEVFRLNNACLISAKLNYGTKSLRHGEFVWKATREFSAGVLAPVYVIT